MTLQQVEWVLVIRYGISAHRATYGRLPGQTYTKDYIQLSKKTDFISDLEAAFPEIAGGKQSITIEFQWPSGVATGKLFRQSADRPHLAWETNSAPPPWKMSLHPSGLTVETILGDPNHTTATDADLEHKGMIESGFGQPFLIAIKLRQENKKLHLRVHLDEPKKEFQWAALDNAPQEIQDLAMSTSQNSALAWQLFTNGDGTESLYFDSSKKIDPWANELSAEKNKENEAYPTDQDFLSEAAYSLEVDNDSSAEMLPLSNEEVSTYEEFLRAGVYEVANSSATIKTRGSAQRVFAEEVKKNYSNACAMTGIKTRDFLIASHIVPWSIDETIRLDPSNGICLSVFVDRAFENGFIILNDDLTVKVNWEKIGKDEKLKDELQVFDGVKISSPKAHPPKAEYLKRRREMNG